MPGDYGKADIRNQYGSKVGEVRWAPDHSANLSTFIITVLFWLTIGVIVFLVRFIFRHPRIALPILGVLGGVVLIAGLTSSPGTRTSQSASSAPSTQASGASVPAPQPAAAQAPAAQAPFPTVPPAANAVQFQVHADRDWQDTGIRVAAGQTMQVDYASGQWSPWSGLLVDGAGCTDARLGCSQDPNHSTNIASGKHGALIARVGNGQPVAVGNGGRVAATAAGTVMLRINDTSVRDNSGTLTVRVTPVT